jgi:hypothetical protein
MKVNRGQVVMNFADLCHRCACLLLVMLQAAAGLDAEVNPAAAGN